VYYFNARFRFKVPSVTPTIPGSIIAASAIYPVDLQKREFTKHPHFKRKYLDPQLYMASLDPALDGDTVARLAAYPWFHGDDVPKYKSGEHSNRTTWKKTHKPALVSKWTRAVPVEPAAVQRAARAAVEFQLKIGCDGIVLAAPLTTMADQTLQAELTWLEAGLDACEQLNVTCPVYATIAVSEDLLQAPALKNPIIHSLSNQVATRAELAGAYVVFEQFDPNKYFWTSKDALMSLLILVDDLQRGANKKIIVNYFGTFGLVAKAVGAHIWSSGYYLTQRRFSRKGMTGRARPRYHSLALAGDIGLKEDLARIQQAGLADRFMTPTTVDAVLRAALKRGKTPADVPQWKHSLGNCAAAQEHYLEIATTTGGKLDAMAPTDQIEWVHDWLKNAVDLTNVLKEKGLGVTATETDHQKVWLDVFEEWRSYAKQ
jgi:hypothetical protein